MKYAQINQQNEVLAFPRTLSQLVESSVITSVDATPEELTAAGVVLVEQCTTQPLEDEYIKDIRPVLQQDGTWKEEWVRLETSEQYKAEAIRSKRSHILYNRKYLLSNSDWTQMPDAPVANKQAWAVYRQALRDITDQPGFPFNVEFPQQPE